VWLGDLADDVAHEALCAYVRAGALGDLPPSLDARRFVPSTASEEAEMHCNLRAIPVHESWRVSLEVVDHRLSRTDRLRTGTSPRRWGLGQEPSRKFSGESTHPSRFASWTSRASGRGRTGRRVRTFLLVL